MYPRHADVHGAHGSTKRDRKQFMSIPDPLLPDEPLPQRISRIFAWLAGACILFGCGALISARCRHALHLQARHDRKLRSIGLHARGMHRPRPRLHRYLEVQHPGRHPARCLPLSAARGLRPARRRRARRDRRGAGLVCLENPGAIMEHECPIDLHHADADGAAARRLVDRPALVRIHGHPAPVASHLASSGGGPARLRQIDRQPARDRRTRAGRYRYGQDRAEGRCKVGAPQP